MRKLKARLAKYGIELDQPVGISSLEKLSTLHTILHGFEPSDFFFKSQVSNGTATYNFYTDNDELILKLDEVFFKANS